MSPYSGAKLGPFLEEGLARGLASPASEAVVKDYVASRKGQN